MTQVTKITTRALIDTIKSVMATHDEVTLSTTGNVVMEIMFNEGSPKQQTILIEVINGDLHIKDTSGGSFSILQTDKKGEGWCAAAIISTCPF